MGVYCVKCLVEGLVWGEGLIVFLVIVVFGRVLVVFMFLVLMMELVLRRFGSGGVVGIGFLGVFKVEECCGVGCYCFVFLLFLGGDRFWGRG